MEFQYKELTKSHPWYIDKSSVLYKKTTIRIIPQIITEMFCTIKEVCATAKKGKNVMLDKVQTLVSTIICNKSLANSKK